MSRTLALLSLFALTAPAALAAPPVDWSSLGLPEELFAQVAPWTGPRLGVGVTEMTPELRLHLKAPADAGVLVSRVEEDSAAQAAGLQVGDVIVRLGGELVGSALDLRRAVASVAGGPRAEVEVVRDGKWRTLKATIAAVEDPPAAEGFTRQTFEIPGGFGEIRTFRGDLGEMVDRVESMEAELDALRARVEALEGG